VSIGSCYDGRVSEALKSDLKCRVDIARYAAKKNIPESSLSIKEYREQLKRERKEIMK